mmetsp:Transcript_73233/g.191973  ORF Transcript_73233/g.191973 Transcript_73233/m.191973 type:complete len:683 (-) Transcript_73233:1079-3127(-)
MSDTATSRTSQPVRSTGRPCSGQILSDESGACIAIDCSSSSPGSPLTNALRPELPRRGPAPAERGGGQALVRRHVIRVELVPRRDGFALRHERLRAIGACVPRSAAEAKLAVHVALDGVHPDRRRPPVPCLRDHLDAGEAHESDDGERAEANDEGACEAAHQALPHLLLLDLHHVVLLASLGRDGHGVEAAPPLLGEGVGEVARRPGRDSEAGAGWRHTVLLDPGHEQDRHLHMAADLLPVTELLHDALGRINDLQAARQPDVIRRKHDNLHAELPGRIPGSISAFPNERPHVVDVDDGHHPDGQHDGLADCEIQVVQARRMLQDLEVDAVDGDGTDDRTRAALRSRHVELHVPGGGDVLLLQVADLARGVVREPPAPGRHEAPPLAIQDRVPLTRRHDVHGRAARVDVVADPLLQKDGEELQALLPRGASGRTRDESDAVERLVGEGVLEVAHSGGQPIRVVGAARHHRALRLARGDGDLVGRLVVAHVQRLVRHLGLRAPQGRGDVEDVDGLPPPLGLRDRQQRATLTQHWPLEGWRRRGHADTRLALVVRALLRVVDEQALQFLERPTRLSLQRGPAVARRVRALAAGGQADLDRRGRRRARPGQPGEGKDLHRRRRRLRQLRRRPWLRWRWLRRCHRRWRRCHRRWLRRCLRRWRRRRCHRRCRRCHRRWPRRCLRCS